MELQKKLLEMQDVKYQAFNGKLVKDVECIGIQIPRLRCLAKDVYKNQFEDVQEFLSDLPHTYLEENHLHAFILEQIKDFDVLLEYTNAFLPYIDNWQTCDSFLPKLFKDENNVQLQKAMDGWLHSNYEFMIRYAIRLKLYQNAYKQEDILKVMQVNHKNRYYVYMAMAWYFSMAAYYNEEGLVQYLNKKCMGEVVYQQTIQKIKESKRFSKDDILYFSLSDAFSTHRNISIEYDVKQDVYSLKTSDVVFKINNKVVYRKKKEDFEKILQRRKKACTSK